jgi:transcription elongation factor Elf1
MLTELCPDCEHFPPHIVSSVVVDKGVTVQCYECRHCGYYWEEGDPTQDFFQNMLEDE